MNNIDYNKMMEEIIKNSKNKPKLLLHACCAPCSTSVIEKLINHFDITIYFYNPNMDTLLEFEKRKGELIKLVEQLNNNFKYNIKIVNTDFDNKKFYKQIKGFENCKEGGDRCNKCFELRLEKTCLFAKENNFDYFATTLTVSPYKNAKAINDIGKFLEEKYKVKYLFSDFKKKDGYKRSIELSKKYNLYRQNYCGCIFSKIDIDNI